MSTVVKDLGAVSAYAYAVEKGYTGTEAEFAELMADYAEVGQRAEDAADRAEAALDEFTSVTADATTLPEGSSATAEYSDGHLTFGIPKGDTGDGAYHIKPSGESFIIHTDADGVATAQEFRIYLDARQGTVKKNVTSVTGLPNISLVGGGTIAPEVFKNAFSGNISVIIYTIPAGAQIATEQIDTQYIARVDNGTANGFNMQCALSVAVVKDGEKGDKGDTGPQGIQGIQGPIGATPNLTIGTVTTLQPTAPATATISGTADNPVLSFGIPKGDTGEVSQAEFDEIAGDVSQLKSDLSQKANQDGYYADLVSGGSTQLLSDMVATDTTPYNYRTAGGSLEIGDRMKLKKIVGGSLFLNQLIRKHDDYTFEVGNGGGLVITIDADGYINITGTASERSLIALKPYPTSIEANHVAVLLCDGYSGFQWGRSGFGYITLPCFINKHDVRFSAGARINIAEGDVCNIHARFMAFDLTLTLGSTIADYVYGLETATAGAGAAWLKSHFSRIFNAGYIPYNAGTLEHVSGLSAHKMTGFNQWDEEWEVGGINANTGENVASTTMIRSKNFCKCLPNTQYCKTAPNTSLLNIFWYDADKQFISASGGGGNNPYTVVTSPDNAHYFKIRTDNGYGTTYGNNICISLHWDGERDGEYEPYESHSYALDSDVTLRGIPKLDANNNLYYDGDEYEADGTVTRRYGIVDLGALSWSYQSANLRFYTDGIKQSVKTSSGDWSCPFVCVKYKAITWSSLDDKFITLSNSNGRVFLKDTAYTDSNLSNGHASWLEGVYLVYELATPTTEEADPYTEIQNVSNWGTEEFVTTSLVPVGHETEYQPDLRAKIEVAPESPDTDGLYLMKRENGQNSYVAYLGELPSDPTTDGTYTLKCTVASGVATKTWEADT